MAASDHDLQTARFTWTASALSLIFLHQDRLSTRRTCVCFLHLKLLAQIPTLQSFRALGVAHRQDHSGYVVPLQLKEAGLTVTYNPLEISEQHFSPSIIASERLHHTQSVWSRNDCSIHIPQVIINALLDSGSVKSMTTLLLDDVYDVS